MPVDFTLPPDTRATGTGYPAQDVDNIVDALTAMGVGLNVCNTAFAGGADPTGVADSSAAFQAAMDAARATGSQIPGEVIVPPGGYILHDLHISGPFRMRGLGPSRGYNSAVTGAVATKPAVTINCAASTYLFNMPSAGYLWGGLEMAGLNINMTGTGNVFDSVNFADSVFRDMTVTLTASGSMIMTCSGSASFLNVVHEKCTFVTMNAVRSNPMFSISSSIGAGISNTRFRDCKFSNAGQDNTQFMVLIQCTGAGSAYHVADNFEECWFEHPFGGVLKCLSGSDIKLDRCIVWDVQGGSPLIGNSLYYFGAYPGNSGSQGIKIESCGRNLNGPDGTSTNKWDVECESTTSNVQIEGYHTTPLNPSTTYNVYFNFHGCNDVLLLNNQSPQGASVNGNSTTVITNPSPAQVVIGAGNVSVGGASLSVAEINAPDAGWLAWNFDPALINTTAFAPVSGTIRAMRINLRRPTLITNVILYQQAAGITLTSGQNFAGLWDSTGARVGITADQSGVWNSGVQVFKTMALASGPFLVSTPWVWLLALSVGTTPPTWGRAQDNFATSANAGLGANNARYATGAAGQTALPAGSITPSSYFTLASAEIFAAVS